MWDINKIKNYRLKYKRYYGIDFDSSYVIHHIDFNRDNNEISNLLLLPKELHARYHLVMNALMNKGYNDGMIDFRLSNANVTDFNFGIVELLPEVIYECNEWIMAKRYGYK